MTKDQQTSHDFREMIEVTRPECVISLIGKRKFIDGKCFEFKVYPYAPTTTRYYWERVS